MAKVIDTNSPEYMASLTAAQLRILAASTEPAHIVPGFAAQCEPIMRGENA